MKFLFIFILATVFALAGFSTNSPTGATELQMPPKASQICIEAVKEYRKEQNSPYATHHLSQQEIEKFIEKRGHLKYKVLNDVFDKCKLTSSSEFKRILTIPTSFEEKQCLFYIKKARQYYNMSYNFYKAKNIKEQNKFLDFSLRDMKKAEILCNKKGASKETMKTLNFYLEEIPRHLNEIKKNVVR